MFTVFTTPDSKVHGANMGPIWGRQDPGWPHVGPMNFAIWDSMEAVVAIMFVLPLTQNLEMSPVAW